MKPANSSQGRYLLLSIAVVGLLGALGYYYRGDLWEGISAAYRLCTDREQIKAFIASFGMGAPVVFIAFQIFQVLFAPIPGEATGFIGGFLFGTLKGFVYSSIGLAVGSWLSFLFGRFLGRRYVRKLIPAAKLEKFDRVVKRQGVIVLFLLFVFPGFPKDYLCLFLGLSALPLKIFLFLATIGRMPGTFMLSLQGAHLFNHNYQMLALVTGIMLIPAVFAFRYREALYEWLQRFNGK